MLGIHFHLGRPHRITTMLSFGDIEKYQVIKTALAELSEKHLRPKIGATTTKRRAK